MATQKELQIARDKKLEEAVSEIKRLALLIEELSKKISSQVKGKK